jgi:8-oxo-dGTP diphosphatase
MRADVPYTEEDMKNHQAISAIIQNELGQILIFKHKKFDFWTVPIGKVKIGQSVLDGLKEELFEEVGITVKDSVLIETKTQEYDRRGLKIAVTHNLFSIIDYVGIPFNKEPEKHSDMKWIDLKDIVSLGEEISDSMRIIKKYFRLK